MNAQELIQPIVNGHLAIANAINDLSYSIMCVGVSYIIIQLLRIFAREKKGPDMNVSKRSRKQVADDSA